MVTFRTLKETEERGLDHFAFDRLICWTKGVIENHKTYSDANRRDLELRSDTSGSLNDRLSRQDEAREFRHIATRARHDFLSAAQQMYHCRNWVMKRKLACCSDFAEINRLQKVVKLLRDMHQHEVEYFKEEGRRRNAWEYTEDNGTADASATVDGKFGGRLDPAFLARAAERLLPKLEALDPEAIARTEMLVRIELRSTKWTNRLKQITKVEKRRVSRLLGASIEMVELQAKVIESE